MWESIELNSEDFENVFRDLINDPINMFSTKDELLEFLELPNFKEELIALKNIFIDDEMYEWAAIIQRKLNVEYEN